MLELLKQLLELLLFAFYGLTTLLFVAQYGVQLLRGQVAGCQVRVRRRSGRRRSERRARA